MSTKAQQGDAASRVELVDVLRGVAVVFMLWMHTADGWLSPGYRHTELWELVRMFGGMAAPLFLLLSGVSLALVWQRSGGEPRTRRELPRALQLVVLGYLLRLQMWLVDGGGFAAPTAWLPLLSGYGALYLACDRRGGDRRRRAGLTLLGTAAVAAGLWRVSVVEPARVAGLLRVDILQAIGASLALTTLVAAAIPKRVRTVGLLATAAATALATHGLRQWVPGPLPEAAAAYLAYWRPAGGGMPMALFPLFPWLAYALAGAAIGTGLAREAGRGRANRRALVLAAVGAPLAYLCMETAPHAHGWIVENPWLSQPIRVGYRLGVGLCYVAVAAALAHRASPVRRPLATLGRASLLVYWVHLQLAFGMLGKPLSHRLEPVPWLGWLALLALAMWALAALTEGLRRGRGGPGAEASGGGITKARMGLVT